MDIIFKLRFLLWVLVLGLWGILVLDFFQDESAYQPPRLTTLQNPFAREGDVQDSTRVSPLPPEDVKASPGPLPAESISAAFSKPSALAVPAPEKQGLTQTSPAEENPSSPLPLPPSSGNSATAANPGQPAGSEMLASLPKEISAPRRRPAFSGVPHAWGAAEQPQGGEASQARERQHAEFGAGTAPPLQAPEGFVAGQTAHFTVFFEGKSPPQDFLVMLENLHSNLMLDLAAFAPWARSERVTLYVFQTQGAYQRFTGRPAWSGGASWVDKRTVFLYKSSEMIGILAHELCHVYFDSFFSAGRADPLWLSEGMATYIQIQRGLAAPNWIRPNMGALVDGKGYSLKEFVDIQNLSGASDSAVRLWYAEAYTVVRFLVRSKWFVSYYQFCKSLRDGIPINEALFKAYGMPYNRLSSLEYAWRYDLKTHGISNLAMSQATPSE
jgi:hypothetical protein